MSERVIAPPTYYLVFAALIGFTLLTVAVDFIDLGAWHAPVGLTIAVAKSLLVALIFMHVWQSSRLTWLIIAAGLFWLFLLIGLTLNDYLTRSWSAY